MNPRRPRAATRPRPESLEGRQLLAQFTVTNTGDSGPGSFRQAILDLNATHTPGGIGFAIPQTLGSSLDIEIDLLSELPAIGPGASIQGPTDINNPNAVPRIVLNGSRVSQPAAPGQQIEGLVVNGDNVLIANLTVEGFAGDQVLVTGQNATIIGDHLGDSRYLGSEKAGLSLLGSSHDTIGRASPDGVDTFVGAVYGVVIGPGSSHDVIQDSTIAGNSVYGLYSAGGTYNLIGSINSANVGDHITDNGQSGVVIVDTDPPATARPQYNLISGDFISRNGTPRAGLDDFSGRGTAAVELLSSSGDTIGGNPYSGGSLSSAANQIIDNFGVGIFIGADPYVTNPSPAEGDVVTGNAVGGIPGASATPPVPIGNHGNAVELGTGATNVSVGPGNYLSYNGGDSLVDHGTGDHAAGNIATNDRLRVVDFTATAQVVPASGPYAIGSTVEVDYTVVNNGPGYAGPATLRVVKLDNEVGSDLAYLPLGQAGLTVTQPDLSTLLFTIPASVPAAGGPFSGQTWVPGGRATVRVGYKVLKAGQVPLQSAVSSQDSFDVNPNDKGLVVRLNLG